MSKTLRVTLMVVFLLLMSGNLAAAKTGTVIPDSGATGAAPVRRYPAAPSDTEPILLVDEDFRSFALGGGMLYWETDCANSVDHAPVYLRRRPEPFGITRTLYESLTHAQCERVSPYNIADEDGFFYANYEESRLDAWLIGDLDTILPIASLEYLRPVFATDADYVYYNQSAGIYRANKDGTDADKINNATDVTGLAVDDTYIYWLDDTGLWRASKTCITPGCWNDKEELAVTTNGEYLSWQDETQSTLLWVNRSNGYRHISKKNLNLAYGASSLYSAPDDEVFGISRIVYHDGCYFWLENTANDYINGANNRLLRMCNGPSSIELIAEELGSSDRLSAGSRGVIFSDGGDLYTLPYDADPIVKDFNLEKMEVTQGIQNLYNDVVLVAYKETYARVYGTLTANNRADAMQVALHAYRGSSELSGSPIYPIDGPRPMIPGEDWDRAKAEDSWIYQLPQSWIASGDLRLEAVIDPRNIYNDPTPGNNTLVEDVTFTHGPPLCIVFVPVRTHAGKGSTNNPYFGSMIDLTERLLPVPAVHTFSQSEPVEELQICWKWGFIPYPCWGPYELDEEGAWHEAWRDDESSVIDSLAARWLFSDDPDVCDNAGANTHYVGMVHPDSATMGGNTLGIGRSASLASWVKFPPHNEPSPNQHRWTWPRAGATVAHELGHNYERMHVDCGGPNDLDNGYPYHDGSGTNCVLDDGALTSFDTHFAFDINEQTPIQPNMSGLSDLMSYASKVWTSDYTWEALFSRVDSSPWEPIRASASTLPSTKSTKRADLSSTGAVVLISGVVTPSLTQGALSYAWVYPTNSMSQQMLGKWQTLAVPNVQPASPAASTPGLHAPVATPPPPMPYHIRLRDVNGAMLADYAFEPELILDGVAEEERLGFMLTFEKPSIQVGRIDLMLDNTVVHSLTPGTSMPDVQILAPAGGETFDDQMTLIWQASDADSDDRLLYNVQYSPDMGQTWRAVVTQWPGYLDSDIMTLTLDSLVGLPGSSTGGLIRVAASDGYNTRVRTSAAFVLSNQAPQPYIMSPVKDQVFEAGDVVVLRGGASDTEQGNLEGEALSWDVTGQSAITGTQAFLAGLAPGSYDITLTAEDAEGMTNTAQTTLEMSPLYIPEVPSAVDDPDFDGFCDDEAYADSPLIALRPYPDGDQGAVHLVRSDDYLWACFSGLNRGSETMINRPMNAAGLLLDVNYSRESDLQADDYWFFVQEDGTPTTWAGTTWGGTTGPGGLSGRVIANGDIWHAELRIDASVLGGWGHVIGLELMHVWVPETGGSHYSWPYKASNIHPDTWATTALGQWPKIVDLNPNTATEDSSGGIVFVTGEDFDDDAVALWNGVAQTTAVIGDQLLSFSPSAADLGVDGMAEVRVQNPGMDDAPSNALTFVIKNPKPEVTALTPDEGTEGDSGAIISVSGQGFDNGAVALWNGKPMTTSVVGSTLLMFSVDASELSTARRVPVTVRNPSPSGGLSDVITFTIVTSANQPPNAPSAPNPANGVSDVPTDQVLSWQGSDPDGQILSYDLAFGTSNPPPAAASDLMTTTYNPGQLQTDTTYYWRLAVSDGLSTTIGPLWSFDTSLNAAPNRAPATPSKPNPSLGLSDVPLDAVLYWYGGDPDGDAVTYTLALGESNPPPVVATGLASTTYTPSSLAEATMYYWRVTATDGLSTTTGPIWAFSTVLGNYAPYAPYKPSPADSANDIPLNATLIWQGGDPDTDPVTYSVAFGTTNPPPVVATDLSDKSYTPSGLVEDQRYYWRIVASDGLSTTTGPTWSFNTVLSNQAPREPYKPSPADRASDVLGDPVLIWRSSDPDRDPLTYTLALGTSNPPPVVATDLSTASYTPPALMADTRYYWVITATDGITLAGGPTWSFTTMLPNRAPYSPYGPTPADRAVGIPTTQVFSWIGKDPDADTLTYDVYFGTSNPPPVVSKNLTTTVYDPGLLNEGTTYYWAIRASDGVTVTAGSTWRFTTTSQTTSIYLPLITRQ